MQKEKFSSRLITWYEVNHRKLPWRETNDPYRIWLSEIMLQQTRVAQGLPYYERFVAAFPSVAALAKAPEQNVLRLWQGLGYYSRARNLHKCAQEVVNNFSGQFPSSFLALKKLPGIGDYTAAAIASIAFKEAVAVVDGNVFRVLSRVYGIETDIASSEGKIQFSELANKLIDKERPDLFNQALMEFGALHCTPKNPKCDECIFSKNCVARQKNMQALLPVKARKLKVRTRYFFYFILKYKRKILMKPRTAKDIWHGLYDFYLVEKSRPAKVKDLLSGDSLLANGEAIHESKTFTHLLSHQKLKVKFVELALSASKARDQKIKKCQLVGFTKKEITELPKPILIDRYLKSEGIG